MNSIPRHVKTGSPHCPKCGVHTDFNPSGVCGAYHANNMCPLRSPAERMSGVAVGGVEATCGELVEHHRTGAVPDSIIHRSHEAHS